MKKQLGFVAALFLATASSAQMSTEISKEEFHAVLADANIERNWEAVQSIQQKEGARAEDTHAVYSAYLAALKESALNTDQQLHIILAKEIDAVEQKISSKK